MSDIEEQRKYYERMMDEVGTEYRRRIADLQAENEKLRELVRYMWRTFMGGKTTAAQRAELRERMRELGMEVDA